MAADKLVCSCDAQPFDGRGDVVTTHQKAEIQKLHRALQGHRRHGGYGRTKFGIVALVVGLTYLTQRIGSHQTSSRGGTEIDISIHTKVA